MSDIELDDLLARLLGGERLSTTEFERLVLARSTPGCEAFCERLAAEALRVRRRYYGNDVFIRGLVEISSYCRNNCFYCGIRAGNAQASRYRLAPEQILACADEGWQLGFRTLVLQGGEDAAFTDSILCNLIGTIKARYPEMAVTLSLGERGKESFSRLREAGADRYLLRHETADGEHYARLHPPEMSHEKRLRALADLRELGFQVGAGFMVGSPFQTSAMLAKDLSFIADFKPEMCGIGPFIPHHATPFADRPAGSVELTCHLLSLIRLIHPQVLLPATTALGTLDPCGREKGLLAGANVVMPNLSPVDIRAKYALYDGKLSSGSESAQGLSDLRRRVESLGFTIAVSRGDYRKGV